MDAKEIRLQMGLSQRETARMIGISQASISLFESGKKPPTHAYLLGLRKLAGQYRHGTSPFTPEHRRRKAALGATWQQVIEAGLATLEERWHPEP